MIVYFGETITVTATGQAWRAETCKHCGQQFYYLVRSKATGTANNHYFLNSSGSAQRAEGDARNQLDRALREGVVPVPCPHCAMYQDEMLASVRAGQCRWMRVVGLCFLGSAPLLLFLGCLVPRFVDGLLVADVSPSSLFQVLILPVISLLVGVRVLWAWRRRQERYDPNAPEHSESRRRLAEAWALKPEEFLKLQLPATPRNAPLPGRGQLVNQNCARCGQRIPDELDSRFCRGCGSPVHNRCAVPSAEGGCAVCGANATLDSRTKLLWCRRDACTTITSAHPKSRSPCGGHF